MLSLIWLCWMHSHPWTVTNLRKNSVFKIFRNFVNKSKVYLCFFIAINLTEISFNPLSFSFHASFLLSNFTLIQYLCIRSFNFYFYENIADWSLFRSFFGLFCFSVFILWSTVKSDFDNFKKASQIVFASTYIRIRLHQNFMTRNLVK